MALVNLQRCFNRILQLNHNKLPSLFILGKYSTDLTTLQYDKDPGAYFINPNIQKLLKSMTRMQLNKIYRKRSVPDNNVEYKFMTTEQLEKEFTKAIAKAEEYLQMPPVVKIKDDHCKTISNDPALKNFSNSKYVIADITYGVKQSKRKILIRNIDGTLQYAPQDIQKRINQIYFPLSGRKIRTPHMFEDEHLKRCLNEYNYEYILDRLCVQYEPYEKDYHVISSKVYTHINEHKKFDDLRSTRHFGPMAFFLAWHKIIDDLLYDMIKKDYLRNGAELISLTYQIHNIDYDKSIHQKLDKIPENFNILDDLKKSINHQTINDDIHEEIKNAIGKTDNDFQADDICLEFIEQFIKTKSLKKVQLELAIQTYKEINDEKKKLYYGLKKAHGLA